MKLTKIHRLLKLKLLKPYIDFNTKKKKQASNSFEKDFFKLVNLSVCGETIENLKNRVGVRIVANVKDYQKLVNRPTFVSQNIFNKNLVAVHKIKEVLMLNQSVYVGMCTLDLSKTSMYDFH